MTFDKEEQFSRIIAMIAAKHGIALSEDDPILMVYTLNEILLEENSKAHQLLLNNFRSTLEDNLHHWLQTTEKRANSLSQTNSRHTHQLNEQIIKACLESIDQKIESCFNEKLSEISSLSQTFRSAALIYLGATSLFLAAVMFMLLLL